MRRLTQEPCLDHVLCHLKQRLPEIADVVDSELSLVEAEVAPGPDLEELLQGADATGHGQKGIAELRHACLAGVHIGDDLEPSDAVMAVFPLNHVLRDDTDDLSPGGNRSIGNDPHETHMTTAVDESDAALRKPVTQRRRGIGILRVSSEPGAGEDSQAWSHQVLLLSAGMM